MKLRNVMIVGAAAACFGAIAYAATPVRRSAAPASKALAIRTQYNPFLLKRQPVTPPRAPARPAAPVAVRPTVAPPVAPTRPTPVVVVPTPKAPAAVAATPAAVVVTIAGAPVRPPYRPTTRSPYQPPTRGPYLP